MRSQRMGLTYGGKLRWETAWTYYLTNHTPSLFHFRVLSVSCSGLMQDASQHVCRSPAFRKQFPLPVSDWRRGAVVTEVGHDYGHVLCLVVVWLVFGV